MIFGSVCSGIEAASLASLGLGWEAAWLSEIEPFPRALLAARWPWVPNLGDMQHLPALVASGAVPAPDLLIGGTPCQAFSLAGLRNGLSDSRGALSLTFVELLNAIDTARTGANQPAAIALWENVPGVLSSKDNAFGCFLAGLAGEDGPLGPPGKKWSDAGCVFGPQRAVAWRCLDAQYFGLAQRRKRVFVIASARAGFDPTKVLFEFDGVRRDSAPSREAWQEVAGTLASRANAGGFPGTGEALSGYLQVAPPLLSGGNSTGGVRPPGTSVDTATSLIVVHGTQDPCVSGSTAFALGRNNGAENAVFAVRTAQTITSNYGKQCDNSNTSLGPNVVISTSGVRRLMPVECERLQGFPDNYTAITTNGKPAADGPRYKALGNSMAVPVMAWICKRINNEVTP